MGRVMEAFALLGLGLLFLLVVYVAGRHPPSDEITLSEALWDMFDDER